MIDAGAPVVLVPAGEVGADGEASPAALDAQEDLLGRLDRIRRIAAVRMGLAADPAEAARAVPKVALVSAGRPERSDVTVRMLSMGRTHPALAITGSVALTAAAQHTGYGPVPVRRRRAGGAAPGHSGRSRGHPRGHS